MLGHYYYYFLNTGESDKQQEEIFSLRSNGNGSLSLKPVLKEHEGNYICKADNGIGKPLKTTISIFVHGMKIE